MYESHFGLQACPFAETIRPSAFVPLPSREAALRRLRYGLERGGGPAVVVGPLGTGKTIVARTLARDLARPTIHARFPLMSAPEMLAFLAEEWHAPEAAGPGVAGSIRRIGNVLASFESRGERPLLIVDDAHLITDGALFDHLRLLLNLHDENAPGLGLVLVGEPELLAVVPASLLERASTLVAIDALTEDESNAYILGRLQFAGASAPLFDAATLAMLYRSADGSPRRLNRLADLTLMIAYAQEADPSPHTVEVAAREIGCDPVAA
jgi:type II secretory pathway predicted ATPase ExeA